MAKKKIKLQPEAAEPEATEPKLAAPETEAALGAEAEAEVKAAEVEDPIGDTTDGEARTSVEVGTESALEAEISSAPEDSAESETEPEFNPQPGAPADGSSSEGWKPRPPAKLERLQKILAAAGVASRRSAEAMIEQGRVQVNGKIVTVLGTKADAGRDHIRVDGKLLQGAERLRYFVLNKPKGFVTTVKDPEGRPTVMQFFDKMKERLYPVGRLDYMSEGLLVVTNDGELANRLTKASSGVEKTYLVKVAGQPTEAELDILRGGVSIERGKPGTSKVRTSPARIRQVRQGDNPWYEVVLIEGRNRELRKMFEEIGHFVEKIRRTGYGPLVLDQEPGNLRELEPAELDALRLAAEGKLRTPKSKDLRRRNLIDAGLLPTVLPKPSGRPRQALPLSEHPAAPASNPARSRDLRPKKFGADRTSRPARAADSFASGEANKLFRPGRARAEGFRPAAERTSDRGPVQAGDRPSRTAGTGAANFGSSRPGTRAFDRPNSSPSLHPAARPAWKKDARPARPPARFAAGPTGKDRPGTDRPITPKPAWKKPERPERGARPAYERPSAPRRPAPAREARVFDEDLGPVRPPNLHIEEITTPERSSTTRPSTTRPSVRRTGPGQFPSSRPGTPRSYADRGGSDRPRPSRPSFDRPASSARPSAAKPFRGEGGLARPFTTSSGKPRAGGARSSSKPGAPTKRSSSVGWKPGKPFSSTKPFKPGSQSKSGFGPRAGSDSRPSYGAKRPYGTKPTGRSSSSPRPYTPRTEGASSYRPTQAKPYPNSASRAERKAGPGWKPKSGGAGGKTASGTRAKPKPGSSAKPSHRVKPGGAKRTAPRPGGKRPGAKPGGKKRSY
jgi:23S rRNA pseudouridine2605 synthase